MSAIHNINSQIEIQNHHVRVREDQQHFERLTHEREIRERLVRNEEQRVEANRRMNRPGQNIDKFA